MVDPLHRHMNSAKQHDVSGAAHGMRGQSKGEEGGKRKYMMTGVEVREGDEAEKEVWLEMVQ